MLTPIVAADAEFMVDVLADERMHEFTGGRPLSLEDLRSRYQRFESGRSPDGTEVWLNWIVRLADDLRPVSGWTVRSCGAGPLRDQPLARTGELGRDGAGLALSVGIDHAAVARINRSAKP